MKNQTLFSLKDKSEKKINVVCCKFCLALFRVKVSIVQPVVIIVEAKIIIKPIQPSEMVMICWLMCSLFHITG